MPYPQNILFQVSRPARYTNAEWNSAHKDWDNTPLKVVLCYPDIYEIGMSNLALHILYQIINAEPNALAERVFPPWPDMAEMMAKNGLPLLSLESGHPLSRFDIVAFSLGYELTYTNMLTVLSLGGLALLSEERQDSAPLIIAGGSVVVNPEPIAEFIDAFFIGEAEEALPQLLTEIRDLRASGCTRRDIWRSLARLPGVYVPQLYQAEYLPGGTFSTLKPREEGIPTSIRRQIVTTLPPPPTSPVTPYIEVVHDHAMIEIARGCSRGCRFCQAGVIYRPVRERPPGEVVLAAEELVTNCGYDEISLVSLSAGDYSQMESLVDDLGQAFKGEHVGLSLPSLRASLSSARLTETLPQLHRSGLTLAPETASPRLQRVINKIIPPDDLMTSIAAALERGWTSLKLYFMVGLPTETESDVEAIAELITHIATFSKQSLRRRPLIRVSLANFVPKPHTPFQWLAQESEDSLNQKHRYLEKRLKRLGVKLSWTDTKTSSLEAALSRGDRRLGKVIKKAWEMGACFDSWSEQFDHERWAEAFAFSGIDPSMYARRSYPLDEPLPWGHIDTGVSPNFLKREYRQALAENPTPDCRTQGCHACGLESHPACRHAS